jgi:hypothetical protein
MIVALAVVACLSAALCVILAACVVISAGSEREMLIRVALSGSFAPKPIPARAQAARYKGIADEIEQELGLGEYFDENGRDVIPIGFSGA